MTQSLRGWYGAFTGKPTRMRREGDQGTFPYGAFLLREDDVRRPDDFAIPAPFSELQAGRIVYLKGIHATHPEAALQLLDTWPTTAGLSSAQIACVQEFLHLELSAFWATLADAMVQCNLRGQLRELARSRCE